MAANRARIVPLGLGEVMVMTECREGAGAWLFDSIDQARDFCWLCQYAWTVALSSVKPPREGA